MNENVHNSRTSNNTDLKLGAVNLTRERQQPHKNFTMTSCQQIVMLVLSFGFMDNLEWSVTRISASRSVMLVCPSKITFYSTKSKKRTEKSQTRLS